MRWRAPEPSSWHDVPTLLFGLGAIGMARQPRGVLSDLVSGARRVRTRVGRTELAVEPEPTP